MLKYSIEFPVVNCLNNCIACFPPQSSRACDLTIAKGKMAALFLKGVKMKKSYGQFEIGCFANCPHCGSSVNIESEWGGQDPMTTTKVEEGEMVITCGECNRQFWIYELRPGY